MSASSVSCASFPEEKKASKAQRTERKSPTSRFSGALRSLSDDYKGFSGDSSGSRASSVKKDEHDDEVDVTLGRRSYSLSWSEGRKTSGELNPMSTSFTPFASPPRTMPDIGSLSFSDFSDKGSNQGEVTLPKAVTPPQTASASTSTFSSAYRTPALTNTTRLSSWSRWDSAPSSSSPFTPFSPLKQKSVLSKTPNTPTAACTSPEPASSLIQLEPQGTGKGKGIEVLSGDGYQDGVQTPEETGRYLMITNIAPDITAHDIRNVIRRLARFKILIAKYLQSKGCVTLVFFDPREAAKVYHYLRSHTVALYANSPLVELHCISVAREDVESEAGHGAGWQDFWTDIESVVLIQIEGGRGVAHEVMKTVCAQIGEVQQLQEIGTGGREYVIEYWDTRHASETINVLNNSSRDGMTVRARYYKSHGSDMPTSVRTFQRAQSGPASFGAIGSRETDPPTARMLFQATTPIRHVTDDVFGPLKPISTTSALPSASGWPAPRTPAHRTDEDNGGLPRPYGSFNSPATPVRGQGMERRIYDLGSQTTLVKSGGFASPSRQEELYSVSSSVGLGRYGTVGFNKKHISPDKRINLTMIENGQECRTTVMVKDVPNKLSRQELVDILRDVVPGGFDFVYLRFDFKNACNVGYAFVNFTSLKALYTFHQERVGQKWNMFSSEKVLQICWADIQGKERLINKFRNSDVMAAPEPWRPQIFYTSGPLKGCPEPFPEPDHPSKRGASLSYPSFGGEQDYDTANDYNYTSADFDKSYGF